MATLRGPRFVSTGHWQPRPTINRVRTGRWRRSRMHAEVFLPRHYRSQAETISERRLCQLHSSESPLSLLTNQFGAVGEQAHALSKFFPSTPNFFQEEATALRPNNFGLLPICCSSITSLHAYVSRW